MLKIWLQIIVPIIILIILYKIITNPNNYK